MKGEYVQGKCSACKVRYRWRGRPLLRLAICPKCKNSLERTTYLLKWPLDVVTHPMERVES